MSRGARYELKPEQGHPAQKWGWRLEHLPALLAVTAGLLVGAAIVGWLARGGTGAVGAVAGVAVVSAGYLISTLVMAWADSVHPSLVLPVGLTTYAVKFTLLGIVMAAVAASGWAGLVPTGMGVAAGVVAWTGTHIWYIVRHPPRLPEPRLSHDPDG